ncbi:DUF2341 domain-containing protein, partial [Candidatus Omnitrophota bacterium]
GLVGYNDGDQYGRAALTNSFATGSVTVSCPTEEYAGGLIGYNAGGPFVNNWYVYGSQGIGNRADVVGEVENEPVGADAFEDVGHDVYTGASTWDFTTPVWKEATYGDYPYLAWEENIFNETDLQTISTGDRTARYRQGADIILTQDFADYIINSFTGTFNGNDYTISNLTIDTTVSQDKQAVGLFGSANGATLKNIALLNIDIDAYYGNYIYAGGIAGSLYNTHVSNSYVTGSITADCNTGFARAGGLAGYAQAANGTSTISNSYAACDITGTSTVHNAYIGGLIGHTYVESAGTINITDSYATGDVTGTSIGDTPYVGGMIGRNVPINGSVNITDSYATGRIEAISESIYSAFAGGLAGTYSGSGGGTVTRSYATGDVIATCTNARAYAGSFMAHNAETIIDSYATGSVTATGGSNLYVGGFVGLNSGSITNAYATGSVTYSGGSNQYVGGFVGYNSGAGYSNCFWNYETVGPSLSDTGTDGNLPDAEVAAKTTSQMMQIATFTTGGPTWDFTNTWNIVEGESYPYLQFAYPGVAGDGAHGVSGILYDSGGSPLAGGIEVVFAVNGSIVDSATTGANGFYYFLAGDTQLDPADILLTYINDDSVNGNTLYKAGDTGVTGLGIYENTISLNAAAGNTVTGTDIATAWVDDADDILFSIGSIDFDGDLIINAPFDPGTDVYVAGSWINNSTFTHGDNTVTFDGTGTHDITTNGSHFYDIVFNGSGGEWLLQDTTDIDNNITIQGGTLNMNDQTANVAGNFLKTGGVLKGDDTALMDIEGDLTVNGGTVEVAYTMTMKVAGNVDVSNDDTFWFNAAWFYVDGDSDTTVSMLGANNRLGGYFVVDKAGTAKVTLQSYLECYHFFHYNGLFDINGNTAKAVGVYSGYDGGQLIMSSGEFFVGHDNLTGTGNSVWWCESGWTEDISGGTITVYGPEHATLGTAHFEDGSNFTPTGGTFRIATEANDLHTASIYIAETDPEDFHFHNLVIGDGTNTKTVEMDTSSEVLDVNGDFTISSNATFDTNGINMEVAGDWTNSDGTFNPNGGTVEFDGALDQNILTMNWVTFHNLEHTGDGTVILRIGAGMGGGLICEGTFTNFNGRFVSSRNATISGLATISGGEYWAGTDWTGTGIHTFDGGLTISGGTFTGNSATVDVTDVTISSGVLTAPDENGTFTVSGDWTNSGGTFNAGTGTVTFNAKEGAHTITTGGIGAGKAFNNITFKATAIYNLDGNLDVDGDLVFAKPESWITDYTYYKAITIDYTKVDATLTDFPVLLSFTDADLIDKAKSGSNYVLKFTKADGTELPYEVEHFDNGTGELVAWVKVDTLSHTADTNIFMHYDTTNTNSTENAAGIWDASYSGVWHLDETSGTVYDSTSNNNDGTTSGGVTQDASGQISAACDFNGIDGGINIGNSTTLNPTSAMAVSVWVNTSDTTTQWFIGRDIVGGRSYALGSTTGGNINFQINGSGKSTDDHIADGTWHHLVYQGNTSIGWDIYLDGNLVHEIAWHAPPSTSTTTYIGRRAYVEHENYWQGLIDEVRVSDTALAAEWISTEYANQSAPSSFSSTTSGATLNTASNTISVDGDWDQSIGEFQAGTSSITVGGDFTADGTISSMGYNNASVVLTGTGNLTYNNSLAPWAWGFRNLTVGQSGNTTTITGADAPSVLGTLTVGSVGTGGTLSWPGLSIYLHGANALSLNENPTLSGDYLAFFGASHTIPYLERGYDCSMRISGTSTTANQSGDVKLNGTHQLLIDTDGFVERTGTWNTGGHALEVGGSVVIGNSAGDTSAKTLDATGSTVTIGGNLVIYSGDTFTAGPTTNIAGNWTNSGTFNAGTGTVIFNAKEGSHAITTGGIGAGKAFNNLTFKATAIYNLDGDLDVDGDLVFAKPESWIADYTYYKVVTIDHAKVAATLTDFPMLLSFTDADLKDKAMSGSNYVLKFTKADGTELPYEVEHFDNGTGELVAWVKVDTLSDTVDTNIFMHYDTTATAATNNPAAVWDSDYVGVWHLVELSGTRYDSTGVNDAAASGVTQTADGQINAAGSFDGNNDDLIIGDDTSLDITGNITLSAWVKLSELNKMQGIFEKGKYILKVNPDNTVEFGVRGADDGNDWDTVKTFTGTARQMSFLVSFKGYMYAGFYKSDNAEEDLFRSSDGVTWSEVATSPFDNTRYARNFAVYGDYLYAGTSQYNGSNGGEVWRTDDGDAWTKVYDSSATYISDFAVHEGYLYVSGGLDPQSLFRSATGASGDWAAVDVSEMSDRYIDCLAVHNGYLYAGVADDGKVWRASDGEAFSMVYDSPGTYAYDLTVFKDDIYFAVGKSGTNYTKVFTSTSGDLGTWSDAGFPLVDHRVSDLGVYDGYIYGGTGGSSTSEILRSSDGSTWGEAWSTAQVMHFTPIVFNGQMYMGTFDNSPFQSLVLRTGNGFDLTSSTSISTDMAYVTATYDGATAKVYINGALDNSSAQTMSIGTNSLDLLIGNSYGTSASYSPGEENLRGTIDEARVSSAARSTEWISTEYNNQSAPSSFSSTTGGATLNAGSSNIEVAGDWTNNGSTFNAGTGTVIFNAKEGSHTITTGGTGAGKAFNNITFKATATYNLDGDLDVDGDLVFAKPESWIADYTYYKVVHIDHTKVTDTLTNFPMLFSVTDADLIDKAMSGSNYVLKFTKADGTELPYEVEQFDNGTGELLTWVKVDTVSHTTDTSIFMHYDTTETASTDDAAGVWDSYTSVWHMDDASSPVTDSKETNNGTASGNPTFGSTGQIDDAIYFNGGGDYVSVTDDPSLAFGTGSFSFSAWVNYSGNSAEGYQTVLAKRDENGNWRGFGLFRENVSDTWRAEIGEAGSFANVYSNSTVTEGSYEYVTIVVDRNTDTLKMYVDGALQSGQADISSIGSLTSTVDLLIGKVNRDKYYFDGGIDELRISTSVPSNAWVQTEYDNQSEPSSFSNVTGRAALKTNNYDITIGDDFDMAADGRLNAGSSTITLDASSGDASCDWDTSGGTFIYDTSTVELKGTGTLTTKGWSWISLYNLSCAYPGKTTQVTTAGNPSLSVAGVVTVNGGELSNIDHLVFRGGITTPLVSTAPSSVISGDRLTYFVEPGYGNRTYYIGADCTLDIALLLSCKADNVTFELTRDVNLKDIRIENNATGTVFTTTLNNYNITLTEDFYTGSFGCTPHSSSTEIYFNDSTVTAKNLRTLDLYDTDVTDYLYFGGSQINLTGDFVAYYHDGTYTNDWVIDPGTSTVTFNGTGTQNVTSNGQSLYDVTVNKASGSVVLQDALTVANTIHIDAGTLVDGGYTVNFKNCTIDDEVGLLTSTGTWYQTTSGDISNPYFVAGTNRFEVLQLADSITSTRTGVVTTKMLVLGANSTLTGSEQLRIAYPTENDFIDQGSGSDIENGSLRIFPGASLLTQKAINVSTDVYLSYVESKTVQMTGAWTMNDLRVFGDGTASISEAAAMVLDTNGQNLTVNGSLFVGASSPVHPDGYQGKILFGSGSHTIAFNMHAAGSYTHGYFDMGSADISVGVHCDFTYTTVTPGTSTVILNGTGTQDITSDSESFYNLEITKTSGSVVLQDALNAAGDFTINTGELDVNGKAVTVTGDLVNSDTISSSTGNISLTAYDITSGTITNTASGGSLTLTSTSPNTIYLSGPQTTDGGDIIYDGNVVLTASPINISTGASVAGNIEFQHAVDSDGVAARDLTLTAGTGSITFTGAVGAGGNVYGDEDCVSYWKLDDKTGTTATDSEGGNDGELEASPEWVSGVVGGALEFNASEYDRIRVDDDNSLDFSVDMSFSVFAWIQTTQTTRGGIVNKDLGGEPRFGLEIGAFTSGKVRGLVGDSSHTVEIETSNTLNDGDWHHVGFVFSGKNTRVGENYLTLFVDGDIDASAENPFDDVANDYPLTIGSCNDDGTPTFYFDGLIDEVAIWDRALDADEVKLLHGASLGDINITSAANVTTSSTVNAASFTQAQGDTGATTELKGAVTTTGAVSIKNDNIKLGANITTTDSSITFDGPVVLTDNVTLSTGASGAGNIWFKDTLNSDTTVRDLTLTAGTGNIYFDAAVGISGGIGGPYGNPAEAYWGLNGGVTDSMGSHDGTVSGPPDWSSPTSIAGKVGGAYYFDGNSYIHIDDDSVWNFGTSSFSVAAWFRTSGTSNYNTIISFHDGSSDGGWELRENAYTYDGHIRFAAYDSYTQGAWQVISDNHYDNGQWHYAVAIRDNPDPNDINQDKLYLYIDGVSAATPIKCFNTNVSGSVNAALAIGRAGSYEGYRFTGSIDEVAVWNRALSTQEISTLYNGSSGFTPSVALGDIAITSATNVTANSTVNAASFTSDPGTTPGTTAFNGDVTLSGALDAANNIVNIDAVMNITGTSTMTADVTLQDDADWTLNNLLDVDGDITFDSGSILNAGANNIEVEGDWTNSGAFDAGTGTVIFDGGNANITPGGTGVDQAFNNVTINATGTKTLAGDIKVDNIIHIDEGTLVDAGYTVNFKNCTIDDEAGRLTSTGTWYQTADGNISNPHSSGNTFQVLQIADSVTSTRTAHVYAKKLVLGASSTLAGSGDLFILYPLENDFIDQGAGSDITGEKIRIYPSFSVTTQKAIDISASVYMCYVGSKTIQMTGDWSVGTIWIHGAANDTSEATAMVLDTNGSNLTLSGSLRLGEANASWPNGYQGKILFGSGTHIISASMYVKQGNGGTHGYFDLGSADISVGSSVYFTDATVTPGTSTVTLNGTGTQNITSDSKSFHNLEITKTSGSVVLQDALDAGGDFTINTGELDVNGKAVTVTGNLVNSDTISSSTGNISLTAYDITSGTITNTASGGSLTLTSTSPNTIYLSGPQTTDGGDIIFDGNVVLIASPINISTGTGAGDITFGGTLDSDSASSARDLTLAAGTGNILFSYAVGGNAYADAVSYWNFNGDTNDSVGSNDGVVDGATGTSEGKVGDAYDFDGDNDYVTVTDDDSLDLGSGITLSFWVKREEADRIQSIVSKGNYSLKIGDDNKPYLVLTTGSEAIEDVGHPGSDTFIATIAVYDGELYVAGGAQVAPNGDIYRYDGGTTWTYVGSAGDFNIGTLAVYDGNLYAGSTYNRTIYQYDGGTTWTSVGQLPGGTGAASSVVYKGNLYMGSDNSARVYRYDGGTTWTDVGDVGSIAVDAITVYDGNMYAASRDGHVRKYDGGTGWASVGDLGGDRIVSLSVYDNNLYAGNANVGHVFRYDGGTTWTDVGWPVSAWGAKTLAVYGGEFYAGLSVPPRHIARYDGGTSWTDLGALGTGSNGGVFGMAEYDGKLYATTVYDGHVYSLGDGTTAYSDTVVSLNDWTYVVGTYDGTTAKIYVDGVETGSIDKAMSIGANDKDLLIGNSYGSSIDGFSGHGEENLDGAIDEVAVWSRALDLSEIQILYGGGNGYAPAPLGAITVNSAANVTANSTVSAASFVQDDATATTNIGGSITASVGEIRFDGPAILTNSITLDTSAGNADITFGGTLNSDSTTRNLDLVAGSGNITFTGAIGSSEYADAVSYWSFDGNANDSIGGNNLAPYGTPTQDTGKIGTAYSFSGDDHFESNASFYGQPSFTISMWVAGLAGQSNSTNYLTDTSNSAGRYLLATYGSGTTIAHYEGGKGVETGSYTSYLSGGEWDHLLITGNASTDEVKLYMNGENWSSDYGAWSETDPAELYIGRAMQGGNKWIGKIDEIAIWNRALDVGEIETLYGGGDGYAPGAALGDITIASAGNVTANSTINAASFVQQAGNTDATTELKGDVTTTGVVTIKNDNIKLGADITTTNASITFDGPVVLAADTVALSTGAGEGNVTFESTINSDSESTLRSLTLDAGTGNVVFKDAVGGGGSGSNPYDDAISYWTFDDGTANDTQGNYNGDVISGAVYQAGAGFNGGGTYQFTAASNTYIEYHTGPIIATTDDTFTIAAWIKTASSGAGRIYTQAGGDGFFQNHYFTTQSGELHFSECPGSPAGQLESNTMIDDNEWHFVVAVADGTNYNIYIDHTGGAPDASAPKYTYTSGTQPTSTRMGTGIGGYLYSYDGLIDDTAVWDTALTSEQVASLYGSGAGFTSGNPLNVITIASAGNVTCESTINAASFVQVDDGVGASDTTEFKGNLTTTAVEGVVVHTPNINLDAVTITTAANGPVNLDGMITLDGNATITATGSGSITLGGTGDTVTGDYALSLAADTGSISLMPTDVDTLTLTSGTTLTLNGNLTVDNALDFTNIGGITLAANTTIFADDAGTAKDITFDQNNTITGVYTLTIDGDTVTLFQIGNGTLDPTSLTVTGDTKISLNGSATTDIFVDGPVLFNSPVELGEDIGINTSGADGSITFVSTLDGKNGGEALTVAAGGGTIIFTGAIGSRVGAGSLPVTDGLVLWLDADQLGLDNGDPVSSFTDMSGNGNHAENGVAGSFVINEINGKPVVRFTTSQYLYTSTSFGRPYTIMHVTKMNGGADKRLISSADGNRLYGYWNGLRDSLYLDGDYSLAGGPAPGTDPHLYAVTVESGQPTAFYGDGSYISGNTSISSDMGRLRLNGLGTGTGETSNGDVAEIVIYNRSLSSNELDQVGGYLDWKYDLSTAYTEYTPSSSVALGAITIASAGDVTASSTINAASFTQSAGSGTTEFGNEAADTITLSGALTVTNNDIHIYGAMDVTGASILTGDTVLVGSCDWTLQDTLTVNGDLVTFIGSSLTQAANTHITVDSGDYVTLAGTYTQHANAEFRLYANIILDANNNDLGHVFIGASPDEVTLADHLTATDLTINNTNTLIAAGYDITLTDFLTIGTTATLNASTGTSTITLGGNWTNNGTFAAGGSTVVFAAADDDNEITSNANASDNHFNNLTFESGTYTLQDALYVDGDIVFTASEQKVTITIDPAEVSGGAPLSDFPVLFTMTDTGLIDQVETGTPDEYKIKFTNEGGTTLPYEVESFDNSTGALVAWVKADSISNSEDTILYLYYGLASAPANVPTDVWDSDYQAVWHMTEVDPIDSTSNGNDALDQSGGSGITYTSSGVIGGALDFAGPSVANAYIDVGKKASQLNIGGSTPKTISVWAKPTTVDTWMISSVGTKNTRQAFNVGLLSDGRVRFDVKTYGIGGGSFSTSDWNYITAVYEGSGTNAARIYLNDTEAASATWSLNTLDGTNFVIGAWYGGTETVDSFYGPMDEFRISNEAKSADWIATEYNNQKESSTFYATQSGGGSGATLDVNGQVVTVGNDLSNAGTITTST